MEKIIQIPEWKLKRIEDAIRITLNAYKMRTKETCLFRQMCKASEHANEALDNADTSDSGLNIDIVSFSEERAEVCECTALGNVYVSNGKTRCSICTGIVDFGEQT